MNLTTFHQLTENQFLDTKLDVIKLDKSEILFDENKKLDFVYFLLKGELNINMGKHLMWQAHSKEFVGISSFFTNEPNYSYSADASVKSTIIKIPVIDFKRAIEVSNILNANIMNLLCKRIKLTLSKGKAFASFGHRKSKLNFF